MVVGPPARTNSKRYRLQVEVLPTSFVKTPRLFLRAKSRLVHLSPDASRVATCQILSGSAG